MSYEQFRHSVVSRLIDADLPRPYFDRIMIEIDAAAQDFRIERACTDLIAYDEGVQPIVKMYIGAMAVKNCAKSTLIDYERILRIFFDTVRKGYSKITTNDIRLYLFGSTQSRGWCPGTTDHVRTVINSFYGWCVSEEYLHRNPAASIPVIKVPKKKLKPLKQIELERIRKACKTPRERALVDVLFSSGVRVSEAASLLLEDINWQERSMLVRHGKGDKERIVYFNPEAEISIKNYLDSRDGNSDYLFCKSRAPYTGVSRNTLETEIAKIRKRVPGLSVKPTPHTFRRTTATTACDRGMPVQEIQQLLGHATIETTMKYITVSEDRTKTDYSRFMAG